MSLSAPLNPAISDGQLRRFGGLVGANFNVTTDQSIAILTTVTKWIPTHIIVTNASISLTTAAGGFYTAASKGGTALVAAAQTYSALTGGTACLTTTLAAAATTTAWTVTSIFLSLTTAQGSAATADVYVFGLDLTR